MKQWTLVDHWTGGSYNVSSLDKNHYQAIIAGDASVEFGNFSPEDQRSVSDQIYGAHTRAFNTKCIGVACACMAGAEESAEWPDYGSDYPLKQSQFEQMCRVNAQFCIEYSIPVRPDRVMLHAEVEHNVGIWQRGKWDITVLPWDRSISGFKAVGDEMRRLTSKYILEERPDMLHLAEPAALPENRRTLKMGSRGVDVEVYQMDLEQLRYFVGKIDGHFGSRTRAATLAFQADNDLDTDGIAGPRTLAKLEVANPRPLRNVSKKDLTDSGTLKDLNRSDRVADVAAISGVAKTVSDVQDQVGEVQRAAEGVLGLWQTVQPYWPIAVVVIGYFVWRGLNESARRRRIEDANTGAHVGR